MSHPLTFAERQPFEQVGEGAATWTKGIRLPEGRWWQWCATANPASIRFSDGSNVTTIIETLAAGGISPLHVHPGHQVFIQFQAAVGVRGLFFLVA